MFQELAKQQRLTQWYASLRVINFRVALTTARDIMRSRMNFVVPTRWQELCLRNYGIQFRISDKLSSCVIKTTITGQILLPSPSKPVAQNGLMNLDELKRCAGCWVAACERRMQFCGGHILGLCFSPWQIIHRFCASALGFCVRLLKS